MARIRFGLVFALLLWPAGAFAQLTATQYVTGLTLPVAFIQDTADTANQFVVQQGGRIRLIRNGVLQGTDFLNLASPAPSRISSGGERGLLGMALAPDWATSGRFYVNFTNPAGNTVVARFKRSAANPLVADESTRFDLVWSTGEAFITQPYDNHNGGNLGFGPDGYLYIGMGDGGSGNDPEHRAQSPTSLLGKMLRIDVAVADSHATGFRIPTDNPFKTSSRPEIWSFGLRNPWRWSFDNPARGGTGALVIADVGQSSFEEIDYEPAGRAGQNYGWRNREGAHNNITSAAPAYTPLVDPIYEYTHSVGGSITGGFVYRGTALGSAFFGRYFFGDFVSGRLWSLRLTINSTTGEAAASDLQEHTSQLGSASISSFGVDANGELYFLNYGAGRIYRIESAGPTMSVDKTSLAFGAVAANLAFTQQTSAQTLRLTQAGAGTVTWTVTSGAPWLVVSPASGSGPANLAVSVQFAGSISVNQTANLTFSFTGAGAAPSAIPVSLNVAIGASRAPSGTFDTPIDGSSGLAGSIAVTGWALDDLEVTRVRIWRDPVGNEPTGTLLLVGDATLVEGARPDVQAVFASSPRSSRAGWGYLMLTNFLPGLGNGTFKLYAIAEDAEGHTTTLGSKTIVVNNSAATAPFGAIDTPDQGGVVSGTMTNFGWVLSPSPRRADPPGGGSVQVLIDGAIVSTVPTGWTSRSDLTALFPSGQYPGIATAVGNAVFDSTTLSNGVHTIAWIVTDNLGSSAGIGSRYFTVANGSSSVVTGQRAAFRLFQGPDGVIVGRIGFDPFAAYEAFVPDANGRIAVAIAELDRLELWIGAGADGYALAGGARQPLPAGSHLDPESGRFTWNPGVGFVGVYQLVLGGRQVQITIGAKQ